LSWKPRVNDSDVEQLTAAMARGDRHAVATFYERYFGVLFRVARAATRRDEQFCLDVVHDAVLRIVRTVKPVAGGEAQLRAWLALVVQSVAYDLLRREQRRAARERARPVESAGGGHANGAELAEQVAWLRREVAQLDPTLVELIDLRYARGWTLAAIGARLTMSAGTIDGRLRRAIGKLRRRAVEDFGDER
jgi:RNA polymerase sigma factor (sigma-70 family)